MGAALIRRVRLHNRLLVSLGRGMALTLDQFGTTDEASGGLPGFV